MTLPNADNSKKIISYENGILTLSGGSKWKIPPIGKNFVWHWEVGDNVIVGSGFIQKHKITHSMRDESIEVELIDEPIDYEPIEDDEPIEDESIEPELIEE